MKTLEKFEADIIAFAVGTVAVLVLVSAFAIGAFAQSRTCSDPSRQVCENVCDAQGHCHIVCHNVCN